MNDAALSAPAPAEGSGGFRFGWPWWLVGVGTVLITAGAVALGIYTVSAYQNQPRTLVGTYLTDLEHGHATGALRLAGIPTNASDVLLTDAALSKATDRIGSFSLGRTTTHGASLSITATIRRSDGSYEQEFALSRAGGLPFLPLWRLTDVQPDVVAVKVSGPNGLTFTVGGATPASTPLGVAVSLRAFPGSYTVVVHSPSTAFDVWNADASSTPRGADHAATAFVAHLTSDGTEQAQQAIDAWLDACLASRDAVPSDCPFGVTPDDGITLSDLQWHLDHRPYTSVYPDWTTAGGWAAESAADGRVEASAVMTRTADGATGNGTSEVITFGFRGIITFDGSKAVFTPYVGGSQDQQG